MNKIEVDKILKNYKSKQKIRKKKRNKKIIFQILMTKISLRKKKQ